MRTKLHQEEELEKATECLGESSEHVTSDILVLSALILLFLAETNFCADMETFSVIVLLNITESKEG